MPTCTLIMFIIVWTTYIYLPRRHTACRQYCINVDATHRRRVIGDATLPKRQVPTFTLCMHIWTTYIGLPWRHTTCRQHLINSNATQRRRVGADATLFKRQAPTCIFFICIFTCVTYICLPRRHVKRSSTRVLAI